MDSEQARDLRNRGIAAAKAGQKDEARQLLQQSIRLEPNNEAAWLWLASVARDPRERLFCLQKLLEINPNNEAGVKAMQALNATTTGEVAVVSVERAPSADPFNAPIDQSAPGVPTPTPEKITAVQQQIEMIVREYIQPPAAPGVKWVKKNSRRAGEADVVYLRMQIAGGVLAFLVVLGIVGFIIIWNNPELRGIVFAPTHTPTFTPTYTPTSTPGVTPTPSPTPRVSPTPSPTIPPEIEAADPFVVPRPTALYPPVLDQFIVNSVGLINQGDIDIALPTLSAVRENTANTFDPNSYFYEALALAEAGDADRARRTMEEAEGRLPELNQERQSEYQPLIDAGFAAVYMALAQESIDTANPLGGSTVPGDAQDLLGLVQQRAQAAISGDARMPMPHLLLAQSYALNGDYGAAIRTLDQAQVNPELAADLNFVVERGKLYLADDDPEEAIYQAYVALYADPGIEDAHLLRINAALAEGEPGLAVLYIQTYLFYYPGSTLGWKLLGDARIAEGKPDLALAAYSQALTARDVTPFTIDALIARANLYTGQGLHQLAADDYTAALDVEPNSQIQALRMQAAYFDGDFSTVQRDAEELTGSGVLPDAEIQLFLARALVDGAGPDETDKFRDALTLLQNARNELPDTLRPTAAEYHARVQLELGSLGDAQAAIDEALAAGDTGTRHFLRGQILEARGDRAAALDEYNWVLTWGQVYAYPFYGDAQARVEDLTA
ncbi:MAG: tetratricopeptide repeat protein [Burkholderiales bacterium]|nr:tetratricopeptide repeat protein [Anaerolineae bacterium]